MPEGSKGDQQPADFLEEVMDMKVKNYYRTLVVKTDGSPEHIKKPSVRADIGVELGSPLTDFNLSLKVRY